MPFGQVLFGQVKLVCLGNQQPFLAAADPRFRGSLIVYLGRLSDDDLARVQA